VELLNPKTFIGSHPDDHTNRMMASIIDWFEARGLKKLKADWHNKTWNYEFVEFMKDNQVLATLMTPQGYGEESCWNTFRNVEFAEIAAFYGITYWYTFQVSMLGLGPVFNGDNEAAKHKAAKLLKEGAVFAFGLSEKEHGADIYSSDMMLIPQADGTYVARGDKYYIGNGNEAAMVSTFGKNSETGEYVFFTVDSRHPKYECTRNTVNQPNYVAEYVLHDYPITDDDILSSGQKAWDDMLNTINYCKFNLGFGAIGLATHAFYESLNHAAGRQLYGKYVTDFPQVKRLFTDSYCRLMAMKLFAYRAPDYLRCASADDRRYLLFNPIVKMKVTMQGEKAVDDLWDVIAARGFESEPFFEIAGYEIRTLPKLEGTAHVNMALIVKFMKNYFFNPGEYSEIPRRTDLRDDTFLFHQGPTRGLGNIQFHDYRLAYERFDLPNIEIFKQQTESFKSMLIEAGPDDQQVRDLDYMLGLGELFTLVVYGQLILENAVIEEVNTDLLNQIFDVFVREFSAYAVGLHGKPGNSDRQRELLLGLVQAPSANPDQFEKVWLEQVYALRDQYQLAD
jgi:acyl-CoA dehydrogenase